MRGTHRGRAANADRRRFIPAHAGNTVAGDQRQIPVTVHPRACGEHLPRIPLVECKFGSSPRMRGTLCRQCTPHNPLRFIPAHAGNTICLKQSFTHMSVHPRACGEHPAPPPALSPRRGSSPRMRGTPPPLRRTGKMARFIPAHAGNTCLALGACGLGAVHPRACGEHRCRPGLPGDRDGSSPRMRGTRQHAQHRGRGRRFIPAHAGNTRTPLALGLGRPVHPRACGEHVRGKKHPALRIGSSPRMRGTQYCAISRMLMVRFIPAHAGNTGAARRRPGSRAVHPRACGEHRHCHWRRSRCRGSSPRMRGTLGQSLRQQKLSRFIPAHAGNTRRQRQGPNPSAVHPRACGEHCIIIACANTWGGSSPRMRGTPLICLLPPPHNRFIPAHAGNTPTPRWAKPCQTVHPRACGEHPGIFYAVKYYLGSSPRMRGTPLQPLQPPGLPRFIPAHAGNTGGGGAVASAVAVHPRACGEHLDNHAKALVNAGSSPRMRGTRRGASQGQKFRRFIPAHAGNTSSAPVAACAAAVHPRACGEHSQKPSSTLSTAGSSPRMRGTPAAVVTEELVERFIPAHAGNTS